MKRKTPKRSAPRKKDGVSGRPRRPLTAAEDAREPADELSGDAKEALLESRPESDRWNPTSDSPGEQLPEQPSDDEDNDDGRNESARLVEDGAGQAEDEQVRQASKRIRKTS